MCKARVYCRNAFLLVGSNPTCLLYAVRLPCGFCLRLRGDSKLRPRGNSNLRPFAFVGTSTLATRHSMPLLVARLLLEGAGPGLTR